MSFGSHNANEIPIMSLKSRGAPSIGAMKLA